LVNSVVNNENLIPSGGNGALVSGVPLRESTVPIISVVTINFNGGATLEQTINSVIAQNYSAIEYIVIDGGSTDNSIAIIKRYAHKITYWQSGPDGGISNAFNTGIKKTTGAWVGIINSDDWYEQGAFEALAQQFNEADVLYGAMRYWLNEQPDYVFEANHNLLSKEMTVNHPTTFVRRSWYTSEGRNGVGVFKSSFKYAMDYDLMLRLRNKGARFIYIPKVLANMRLNGASDSQWHKAYKEVLKAKLENGLPKFSAFTYYGSQVIRTFLSRSLRKLGLNLLVAWYRKRFSMIKKTKA